MAAVIGALRVNLGLNSAEFESGMKKASGAMKALSGAFAALGGVAIFAGFTAGIGQAVGRIEEARKLTAQLDQALTNTGNTARTSGKEVAEFADDLEKSTGRAAEEILAVSTNLATFGFSREVFFDAIKLADDMSAAWGGDLRQNMEGLARALADPEKGLAMLTKRGITFTDQQKAMIASFVQANDIIGAQGVVMDALNEQVKGVAASGFTGLTAAQARATKAMEDFFETIAGSLQVNMGLEMSLAAVAAALNFVSANFDVIARAAGVAGTAILTALGPTIWATVSTAAVAMSTAVVGAIRAIGIAIAANPIGLLITAFAAAVAAAFLFRDEIKQAIGVDFVGIIAGAVNTVIGAFVGAFEAIKATWSALPGALGDLIYQGAESVVNGVIYMIREVQVQFNKFMGWIDTKLLELGAKPLGIRGDLMEYAKLGNPFAGEADAVGGAASAAFAGAQGDYIGKLAETLGFVGDEATTAAAGITALGTALDGGGAAGGAGGGSGGAAGGARNLGAAADATKGKLQGLADTGQQVTDTLKTGFQDMFKGLITGSGNAMEAISGLIGKLGDLFLSKGFDMLFGMLGGGAGNFLKAGGPVRLGYNLPGFARGGSILPGGSGGIDSQLVQFRKSPNERVDITKPGQSLGTGGGSIAVDVQIGIENGNLVPFVTQVSGQVAGQQIKQNNKQLPGMMRDINQRTG